MRKSQLPYAILTRVHTRVHDHLTTSQPSDQFKDETEGQLIIAIYVQIEPNQTLCCCRRELNRVCESNNSINHSPTHLWKHSLSLSAGNAERWEAIGSLQLSEVALPNAESPAEIATANTSKTGDRNKLTQ